MVSMIIGDQYVVSNKNFTIKEEILKTSSTILNNCYPAGWEEDKDYTSRFYYPQDYSVCKILNDNVLIFAGVVKNSGDTSLKPSEPKYCNLQILDFKTLLSEGGTLDYVISNKTVVEAINMVISSISSYGFVPGNIEIDDTENTIIGAYSTLEKTPYDVFQYLSEISKTRWFTRMISETKTAIDFYSPDKIPQANQIEYTTSYFENNNITDMKWSFGTRDYRNKQIVLSDEVYSSISSINNITTDGYATTFNVEQNIASIGSIIVGGTSKTFATSTEKGLGVYADFYYTPGSNVLEASDLYTAGLTIVVTYIAFVKGRQVINNDVEISRISNSINRNGIIARYENRNDVLSSDELNKIAQTYINYKGKPEIILTITTQNNDILNVGQQVYFNITSFTELQQNYLVKSKETQITKTGNDGNIFYVYQLSSSYDADSEINYFDNQRRKATGNISANQFVTRNIDVENSALIKFQNLETSQITTLNNNVLNCELEAWFIS
jgi:hypothetical protein